MKSLDVKRRVLFIRNGWEPLNDILQDLLNMDPCLLINLLWAKVNCSANNNSETVIFYSQWCTVDKILSVFYLRSMLNSYYSSLICSHKWEYAFYFGIDRTIMLSIWGSHVGDKIHTTCKFKVNIYII